MRRSSALLSTRLRAFALACMPVLLLAAPLGAAALPAHEGLARAHARALLAESETENATVPTACEGSGCEAVLDASARVEDASDDVPATEPALVPDAPATGAPSASAPASDTAAPVADGTGPAKPSAESVLAGSALAGGAADGVLETADANLTRAATNKTLAANGTVPSASAPASDTAAPVADGTGPAKPSAESVLAGSALAGGAAAGVLATADANLTWAAANETLAANGTNATSNATFGYVPSAPLGMVLTPPMESARCLKFELRLDWRWLYAPDGLGEQIVRIVFFVLLGIFVLLLIWVLVRKPAREKPLSALAMLGGALLATADAWTDIILATEWLRCGHTGWGALGFTCVGLSTFCTLHYGAVGLEGSAFVRGGLYWCERALATVSSALQLGALHGAVARIWRGSHAHPHQAREVLGLRLFQAVLESVPLTLVQAYALLWMGVHRVPWLAYASLALSLLNLSLVLGEWLTDDDTGVSPEQVAAAKRGEPPGSKKMRGWSYWAQRALAPCGAVSRALPIALFACAFGRWLALALALGFVGLVVLLRLREFFVFEGICDELSEWFESVGYALLYYSFVPLVMMDRSVLIGSTTAGEARVVLWGALVDLVLVAVALCVPSDWLASQLPPVIAGAAGTFGVFLVGRLTAAAVVLMAKARFQREKLSLF